jgi:serpin B
MTYAGAKAETAGELKAALALNGFKNDQDIFESNKATIANLKSVGTVSMNTANKIYPNNNFKLGKSFSEIIKNYFGSQVEQLNFADNVKSAQVINSWVSNQTNNKINDLVPADSLDALTQLVLVNAIYFKGNWANQFKKEMTNQEDFFLDNGTQARCDMMKLNGKKFNTMVQPNGLRAMICELPYVGDRISMSIILPDRGVKLSEIESKLDSSLLNSLLKTNLNSQKVNICLPKFKLEYEKEVFKFYIIYEKIFND